MKVCLFHTIFCKVKSIKIRLENMTSIGDVEDHIRTTLINAEMDALAIKTHEMYEWRI